MASTSRRPKRPQHHRVCSRPNRAHECSTYDNAMWNGHLVGWVCGRESHILMTEVVVVASEAHRMVKPVERFSQVVANRPRANRRRGFQLKRVHLRHAQRVNSEKQVASARNGVTKARKGDSPSWAERSHPTFFNVRRKEQTHFPS
jgi:hypothetical protein